MPKERLTRLAALGTLSRNARNAGEGLQRIHSKLLSRTAGEGGPSLKGLVGEGSLAFQQVAFIFSGRVGG